MHFPGSQSRGTRPGGWGAVLDVHKDSTFMAPVLGDTILPDNRGSLVTGILYDWGHDASLFPFASGCEFILIRQ